MNSGPREDSTRIGRAGTVRRQAVDVSPLRRVNQAMWLLCTGAREAAFRNIKTIAECLADELINASKVSNEENIGNRRRRSFLMPVVAQKATGFRFWTKLILDLSWGPRT